MAKQKNHELEKYCRFCEYAVSLKDPDQMLCDKKGIVDAAYHCRAFRYDPLKREPARVHAIPPLEFVSLDAE